MKNPRRNYYPVAGKDYELSLPRGYLSPTAVSTYQRCPQEYYRKYVLKEGTGVVSPSLLEGQLHHRVLEHSNREAMAGRRHLSPDEALDLFPTFFEQFVQKETVHWDGLPPADTVKLMLTRANVWYKKYFKEYAKQIRPIAVEHECTTTLAGVPMLGYADVVEDGHVIDYKVSGRTLKISENMQLDLYSIVTGQSRVGIWQFKPGKTPIVKYHGERRNIKKRTQWLTFQVAHVAHAISMGHFPPINPEISWKCSPRWCDFWKDCYGKYAKG